jgi:hypothetical protein
MAAISVALVGAAVAATPAYATSGTQVCQDYYDVGGVHWFQGYTSGEGYTAWCAQTSAGLPGKTTGYNFRVKLTCIQASHANVTAYGGYSDWKSTAVCPKNYDAGSATIQWTTL